MTNRAQRRLAGVLSLVVAFLLVSISAVAHHGTNISYDHAHPLTVKATVTEFVFKNPHAQIYFDVKDEKGDIEHWSGELTNPSNLMHAGWTKRRSEQELPPGSPRGPRAAASALNSAAANYRFSGRVSRRVQSTSNLGGFFQGLAGD